MLENNIDVFKNNISQFKESDRERILNALDLTQEHSAFAVCVGAASILLDLGLDADTIIAALIRLLPETSSEKFGADVTLLIQGVKKTDKLKTSNNSIYEAQNIRNMLFVLAGDIREIFIVLAEKLAALRVLDSSPNDDKKTAARECLDIYAPLADRLGISWIKNEMEDLSLKFLNREIYQQIKNLVSEKKENRNQFLELAQETLKKEAEGIVIDVESRAKHFYSVYMKMRKRGISTEKIRDLSGMRIICDSVENCYMLLGIVHRLWKPVSGGFKDYIANPKSNGYRSLHTTVIFGKEEAAEPDADAEQAEDSGDEAGKLLEIQIRTREMHQIAEHGVASHWLYKKGASRDMVQLNDIGLVNKLKDWKQVGQSPGEISISWLEEIKLEILKKWVYVFTPQGKVIKLPAGATPIDFAYHVHTAVGEHCIGAKANGSIIPLSSQLKNAQAVEILTSPQAHPHLNWLEVTKSPRARNKIRSWIERNEETHSVEKTTETKKKPVSEVPAALPVSEMKTPARMVVQPLTSTLQVRIEDEKNLMFRFARCCNPMPGDAITGYVSRGRGIIVHRKNCTNLANNPESEKRMIEAEWESSGSALVKRFRIVAKPQANLFSEIEGVIRKKQGHLIEGCLEQTSADRLAGNFAIQLEKAEDLKPVMKNIRGIPGIIEIQNLA